MSNIFKYKKNLRISRFYALRFSWEVFTKNYLKVLRSLSVDCFKINLMLPYLSKDVINIMNKIPIERKVDNKVGKNI